LAHTLSAKKRVRQNEKARTRNRSYKTIVKNLEKKVETAIASKNVEEAQTIFKEYVKKIDSVSRKGILHANKAARKKSRISKKINSIQ
jgi:small subunit ribosomal protein S20